MTEPSLLEYLIKDFQEQKQALKSQIELIDPIATSIRQPVATRLFHNGLLVFLEIIVWLLILGCIALVLFLDKVTPFYFLSQLTHDTDILRSYRQEDLIKLGWSVKAIICLLGLALFWIARMLKKIRLKNYILNMAGKNMKALVEQFLQRRAAMESLEIKFPIALPPDTDAIVTPKTDNEGHNEEHNDLLL